MPTILAIDTATEACSAALLYQNQVDTCFEIIPQQHSDMILPMIDQLLSQNKLTVSDCDAIAFGMGPGSFTGLRIAAGVAQGLALAYQKPLIAISDLAALAWQAFSLNVEAELCVAALDARMHEVYIGSYQKQHDTVAAIMEDCLAKPDDIINQIQSQLMGAKWVAIGSGWQHYQTMQQGFKNPPLAIIANEYPRAAAIVELAKDAFNKEQFLTCEAAQPHYIRDQVVHQKS